MQPSQPGFEPRTRDPERRDFFDLRRRIVAADEVWIGNDPPPADHYELWYDPDADPPPNVEIGTYTPTLASITIGTTGAVRTGSYTYVGDPGVGGEGHIDVEINIVLGTGGSVSAGTGQLISLPPGFEFPPDITATDFVVAHGLHRGTGTFIAQGWPSSGALGSFRPLYLTGTPTVAGITNALPFAWAATHSMRFHVGARVVRV